jgi:hypothetical protein
MAKHLKTKTAPTEKRRPGRPRSSPLDPIEQARVRRQRHRESKRNAGMVLAEIWLPQAWRDAVIARGENASGRGAGSFPFAYGTLGENAPETALKSNPSSNFRQIHAGSQYAQKRLPISQFKCSCRLRLDGGLPVLTPG